MIAEVYALVGGPFDGATFVLEKDDFSGLDCIVVPIGQESMWQVASFDEGGMFIRFLAGALESTTWFIYQYKRSKQVGRYEYLGILIRGDGRSTTKQVVARLKSGTYGQE